MSDFEHMGIDPAALSDEELEALSELLPTVLEQEKALEPLRDFVPNGAQDAVIQAVGNPGEEKYLVYMLPAANSLGKTGCAIAILGNIIWGPQNRYFDLPRFRQWPVGWPKAAWYISDMSVLKQTVCGVQEESDCEIRKWFPAGRYSFTKSDLTYYSELTSDTGWSISFKTYDQQTTAFTGKKVSVIVFDEPPPEAIFNEALARLLTGGIIIMPMTPLYTAAWTAERLAEGERKDIFVLPRELSDIEVNCREHGIRGWLDHDQIQAIIKNYDSDERDARVKGLYMYLIGLVYKNLSPIYHRHSLLSEDFSQEKYRIYNVIDPHLVKPDITGWFSVDLETGMARAVGEFPSQPEFKPFHELKSTKLSTADVCARIRDFEIDAGWDGGLITRVMDPNFGHTKKGDTGLTTQEYFKKLGKAQNYPLNYSCDVNDDVMAGHRIVREYLQLEELAPGKLTTRFQIGTNCPNMWHSITHYKFRKDSDKKAEADGATEVVEKKHKDPADLIRYFFMFYRGPKIRRKVEEPEIPEYLKLLQQQAARDKARDWRDPHSV